MPGPRNVEEYLAALPGDRRAVMESLRATIRRAAPKAVEGIAYQMPAFRQDGRFLVSYAAFRDHFSLFPASHAVMDALGKEIEPFVSGKGTLRFTAERPLPAALVRKIVKLRLAEVAAARR